MNSSIIILFLASIALSVPVGGEGLLAGLGKEIVAAPPHPIPKPLPIANPGGTRGASVASSSSSREKVQLTPEGLELKSLLYQWGAAEQARIRKATLSRAEEIQKLKDPGNFVGENGVKDFARF